MHLVFSKIFTMYCLCGNGKTLVVKFVDVDVILVLIWLRCKGIFSLARYLQCISFVEMEKYWWSKL
jgi:hypothetical protein